MQICCNEESFLSGFNQEMLSKDCWCSFVEIIMRKLFSIQTILISFYNSKDNNFRNEYTRWKIFRFMFCILYEKMSGISDGSGTQSHLKANHLMEDRKSSVAKKYHEFSIRFTFVFYYRLFPIPYTFVSIKQLVFYNKVLILAQGNLMHFSKTIHNLKCKIWEKSCYINKNEIFSFYIANALLIQKCRKNHQQWI